MGDSCSAYTGKSGHRDIGGEQVIGAIAWRETPELVDIHRLIVDPPAHRRGGGTALVVAAAAWWSGVWRARAASRLGLPPVSM